MIDALSMSKANKQDKLSLRDKTKVNVSVSTQAKVREYKFALGLFSLANLNSMPYIPYTLCLGFNFFRFELLFLVKKNLEKKYYDQILETINRIALTLF